MRYFTFVLVSMVLSVSLLGQGQSQGKGKGHGKENQGGKPQQAETAVPASISVVFGDADRRTIQQWVQATPASGLPPGLAKRGELPPGLQKQLRRNGTLPPGLEKKWSPFPADLSRRLAPLPSGCGCERVFLDGRAMVITRATNAILDVINLF